MFHLNECPKHLFTPEEGNGGPTKKTHILNHELRLRSGIGSNSSDETLFQYLQNVFRHIFHLLEYFRHRTQ
ncbi:hypothetical protein HNY73_003070 [Argiope bruennichi]|uniref:Uncharacterized protein n=1 Tax=Argiope bruennichi TaxID=94029 RepID=A0A8T0G1V4_ARGBR|nr:hypothetical protein HNY73_003070 [Argiope bruennichi]